MFGLPHANRHSELRIATHAGEPLHLSEDTRRRHIHVAGQTGTGKTVLIRNLIAQDLVAGRGVAVIDPLGHLAKSVLELCPPHRTHDVVYFDAADLERPIGINPLEPTHPDQHAVVADDIVSAFVHIWGPEAVGDRSQQVLRNSIRALMCMPTASLLGIPRLLTDEPWRERVVRSIKDPVVLSYWRAQFANYDTSWRNQVISPILNKLDHLLSGDLRNIVSQPRSAFSFRRIMDEQRILIVNLAKARGEQSAHVLGALVIAKIAQAAFSREDTPQHLRVPFYIYCDEFPDYASSAFLRILSQSRNYAISLLLAHQYLGQLTHELRDAVLGNAASSVVLRVGAEDAPILAAHLGVEPLVAYSGMGSHETPPETRLAKLPNYQAFARTLVDGAPTDALHLELLPEPVVLNRHPERIIKFSRDRYGTERGKVEDKIARFLRAS